MILGEKPLFAFSNRNRRPPLDPVNALLSFAYSLLTHDCASALELSLIHISLSSFQRGSVSNLS